MDIQYLYNQYLKSSGVVIDSRKIVPNCIFFAIKGDKFDGNNFAEDAILHGAKLAVVERSELAVNDKYMLVNNSLECLQQLANFHRKQLGIKILAITGTNGKTTTKELVNRVLSLRFDTYATEGNLNNHIGVPLTLLSISQNTEFAVIEMGANHPGEIEFLCNIAEPDYGIITNIGIAHIQGFGSFQNIINTKTELYNFLQQKNGIVFYNSDNKILAEHLNNFEQKYCYAINNSADLIVQEVYGNFFTNMKYIVKNQTYEINSNLVGKYNWENISVAVLVGKYFGIEYPLINKAIENYYPKNNRSQVLQTSQNTLILDMYNANPSSMRLAIENFAQLDAENKVIVLGDMFELGTIEEQEHNKIIEMITNLEFSKVYLIGKVFSKINNNSNFITQNTVTDMYKYLENNKITNSTVLLKASRGIGLEALLTLF